MTGFHAFGEAVAARLEKGRREYGDRSFDRLSSELVGEIEEELLDVCGWAFVLWSRIRRLRVIADQTERPREDEEHRAAVEDSGREDKAPELAVGEDAPHEEHGGRHDGDLASPPADRDQREETGA